MTEEQQWTMLALSYINRSCIYQFLKYKNVLTVAFFFIWRDITTDEWVTNTFDPHSFFQAILNFCTTNTFLKYKGFVFTATMFLEFWKRYQFSLSYQWDLIDYDQKRDLIRPEFEAAQAQKQNRRALGNPARLCLEPFGQYSRLFFSFITVLFWVSLASTYVLTVRECPLHLLIDMASNVL